MDRRPVVSWLVGGQTSSREVMNGRPVKLDLALCEVEAMKLACNPGRGRDGSLSQSVCVARSCGAWLTEAGWGRGGQLVNFQKSSCCSH
jgi:hypothetical protein